MILARRHLLQLGLALPPLLALGHPARAAVAYDFAFTAIDGADLPLSTWRGKALLVVNTASFCGYTPQYKGLQALWEKYRDRGLVVLGVPANDFNQEPGTAGEIKKFCEVNYSIDFPLADKVTVTGPQAHPFYRWAVAELGDSAAPRWNFHKYLIGRDGYIAEVFPESVDPVDTRVKTAIARALAAS
jgi:glutathione peroxidase